jgi:ribonuclease G
VSGLRIVVANHDRKILALVMRDQHVVDLFAADPAQPELSGAVVLAKITRLLPAQQAAIVNFGKQQGYVTPYRNKTEGEELLQQVKAEAHDGKLPSLNRDIALPGRFLIYLPFGKNISHSRRIEKNQQTKIGKQLGDLLEAAAGGWVVRSAALKASAKVLQSEKDYLLNLWHDKSDKQGVVISAPSIWQRALIEYGGDCHSITVEKKFHQDLLAWLSQAAPDLLENIVIDTPPASLDLDHLLQNLLADQVALAGGTLMIETTAALTAIDVNAADGENILQVNLRAVDAIARQVRLRNLGGMILVDFIRMAKALERDQLLQKLRQAVADDPVGVEVFGFSRMGLIEMTRVRRGRSLRGVMEG